MLGELLDEGVLEDLAYGALHVPQPPWLREQGAEHHLQRGAPPLSVEGADRGHPELREVDGSPCA